MSRSIRHPGPPVPERAQCVETRCTRQLLQLEGGKSVNEAVAGVLSAQGYDSAFLRLKSASIAPMHYVIPAASPDGAHAAWYSQTYSPAGTIMIEDAGIIAGWRDGAPFIHCHGIWRLADGTRRMGHLLPHDCVLAADAQASTWAVSAAAFQVRDDDETGFRLFAPERVETRQEAGAARALLATIRPNEDVTLAIEKLCRDHAISHAAIHGIGSLVGADFTDGTPGSTHVASYATEVLITDGIMTPEECRLDIALVGMDGAITEGRLMRGQNPVCVTFELLIEEKPAP